MNPRSIILVVDDSQDILDLLGVILTDDGYEVLTATSGELALAAAAARLPDLILLDIRMPGLSGLEVCRRLKAQAASRDIPIIFISAVTESAERVKALDLGAVDFVSKPIQVDELRARVRIHLELHRLQIQSDHQAADLLQANRRLEQELEEHKKTADHLRKLSHIVEQAPLSVVITDLDGTIEYVNPAFSELTGFGSEAAVGQNPRMLKSGRTPPEVYRDMWRALTAGQVWRGELHNRKKSGEIFVELNVVAPVFGPDGPATHYVALKEDITKRKAEEEAVVASLREKEALLKEVHHRVKNNLQIVTSLLRLEAGRSAHSETRSVLTEMQGRILAMALLHETLYRSGIFASVDLGEYLEQLATQSFRTMNGQPGAVELALDLKAVQVTLDQAIPCGLLVNELISNGLKHAFPAGRQGELRIELRGEDNGSRLLLRVSDTGVGLPADFESRRANSLGLQLVSDLAQQLGGELGIGPWPRPVFTVSFAVAKARPPSP